MNFSDIRNRLYDEAEKYWTLALVFGVAVQVVSVASTLIKVSEIVVFLNILLFFVPAVSQWYREKSKDLTQRAMTCRLAIVYSDAFDRKIPSSISKEIASWITDGKLDKAPFKKPYYSSKLLPGSQRLADIISESAYWTYNLSREMRGIMAAYTGIYVFLSIAALYFLLQVNSGSDLVIKSVKIVVVFTSVIFTQEALLLIKQYNELYQEAKQAFDETSKMVTRKKLPTSEVMQVVEKYNLALISAPPIPSRLYLMRQNFLNKAYKKVLENE